MTPRRQHTTPLVVTGPEAARTVSRLERLCFKSTAEAGAQYDEAWLQNLVHAHPELLPIKEIEPAFVPAIPICIELPTPRGYIDNFFLTPTGNLVFAECKLWRNPGARRQVIAQVMDYIESITAWGYADLEDAVRRARLSEDGQPQERLYNLVGAAQELEEAEFVDAVSRNLRLGRGLFFIVGDGIREEAESLTAHLQAHAGVHFTLALVELALFRLPGEDSVLVQPRVITRTVNIERGIVRYDDTRISVTPAPAVGKCKTLSEDEFFEQIAKRYPKVSERLKGFIAKLEPLGVSPEFRKSLILRWHAPDGTSLNLGYILTDGQTWTEAVNAQARQLGILDLTHAYVEELAAAIGGEVKAMPKNEDQHYTILKGHTPRIDELLNHEDAWIKTIHHLTQRVSQRLEPSYG